MSIDEDDHFTNTQKKSYSWFSGRGSVKEKRQKAYMTKAQARGQKW